MFAGTALSVRLFVCAGLSLFIICGPYLSVVVCVFYAYNLTLEQCHIIPQSKCSPRNAVAMGKISLAYHWNILHIKNILNVRVHGKL